jgi:hypothetical protein
LKGFFSSAAKSLSLWNLAVSGRIYVQYLQKKVFLYTLLGFNGFHPGSHGSRTGMSRCTFKWCSASAVAPCPSSFPSALTTALLVQQK